MRPRATTAHLPTSDKAYLTRVCHGGAKATTTNVGPFLPVAPAWAVEDFMERSSQFHLRYRPKLRKLCRGKGWLAIVDQAIRGRYNCLDSWTSSRLSVMASHDTNTMYRFIAFNTRSFNLHFLGRRPRACRPAKDIEAENVTSTTGEWRSRGAGEPWPWEGEGGRQAMRLNRQDAGMRLCTPGSSMTPRGEVRGHKGIAGCPGGF